MGSAAAPSNWPWVTLKGQREGKLDFEAICLENQLSATIKH